MNSIELRHNITQALSAFEEGNLHGSTLHLLETLGYKSQRRIDVPEGDPAAFRSDFDAAGVLDADTAEYANWLEVQFIFQLTADEVVAAVADQTMLFGDSGYDRAIPQSYVFLALRLKPGSYSRTRLSQITRQINKLFSMPVFILLKYGNLITLAIVHRRPSKKELDRDVLEKVTLIKDIRPDVPHRAHVDILHDLSLWEVTQAETIRNFDDLHRAFERVLDTRALNKRFYQELSNWYFWAVRESRFPPLNREQTDEEKSQHIIRLITRLVFSWFLREKGLVPQELFRTNEVRSLLTELNEDSSSFYWAILQNLFFATLNTPMNSASQPENRRFCRKNREDHMVHRYYRHEELIADKERFLGMMNTIPFLNGGLFECLDRRENGEELRIDGFSVDAAKSPRVPNVLFFSEECEVDLSDEYGQSSYARAKVRGIINILSSYKFTVAENTPIEQEVALDPELLGRVFENLLAAYNPETKSTARHMTGSYYTPREIVDYMIDEALTLELRQALSHDDDSSSDKVRDLLDPAIPGHSFSSDEARRLIDRIEGLRVIDPACGSGAFPMGVLQRLVQLLGKLDPGNLEWKSRQQEQANRIELREVRERALEEIEQAFEHNEDDYARKLYLIRRSIFGVDIQPIAVQIAKLRFFISLLVDQEADESRPNRGVRELPNLETKFVAADSLIHLSSGVARDLQSQDVKSLEDELKETRRSHFTATRWEEKQALRKKDAHLTVEIARMLEDANWSHDSAVKLASWNPYNQNTAADWFDPELMLGVGEGFDIVIGNPPYIQLQSMPEAKKNRYQAEGYSLFSSTGDIYQLFYERGLELLSSPGVLTYISSNKWMRANYGQKMRQRLSSSSSSMDRLGSLRIHRLVDFGDADIFENATTYTNVIVLSKNSKFPDESRVYNLSGEYDDAKSLGELLETHGDYEPLFSANSFLLVRPVERRIKEKMDEAGLPLDKWDIRIDYGIKTGYNPAFIINGARRRQLIDADPKSEEIIKPVLKGRDIKRYNADWQELWLINSHNGVRRQGIPRIDVENDYPAIFEHLKQYEPRVTNRDDQGEHWSNLRNCAYLDRFEATKIAYSEIVYDSAFYLDTERYYLEATAFLMTGEQLPYLVGVLNSKPMTVAFKTWYAGGDLRGETFRYKKTFLKRLPVPRPDHETADHISTLVSGIQQRKSKGASTAEMEAEIDTIVYGLFDLKDDERAALKERYQVIRQIAEENAETVE